MYKNAIEKLLKFKLISAIRDDDTLSQVHHRLTPIILVVMAGFFSVKTKWGGIDCWIPKELDSFGDYIHQWCWISNLYRVPFDEELPLDVEERMAEHRSINFFRWVFLMFIVQALMFKIPNFLWRALNTFSGINIRKVVSQALETQYDSEENRDANMKNLAVTIDRWLSGNRMRGHNRFSRAADRCTRIFFCFARRRSGNFLTRLFLFVKLLYLVNLVAQFEILSVFLHFDFWSYGNDVSYMITADDPWTDTYNFPRVGMCDMDIRQLQNIQKHTVQCALPINMFLEKAYAGLWYYMYILLVFTALNIFREMLDTMCSSRRQKFLDKYVKWLGHKPDDGIVRKFVDFYLRDDGIFLLQLVSYNCGELLTFDLIRQLWNKFSGEVSDFKMNTDINIEVPFAKTMFKMFSKAKGKMGKDFADMDIPDIDISFE